MQTNYNLSGTPNPLPGLVERLTSNRLSTPSLLESDGDEERTRQRGTRGALELSPRCACAAPAGAHGPGATPRAAPCLTFVSNASVGRRRMYSQGVASIRSYTRRREAPQDSPQCQPPSNSDNVPHCAPEHGPTYFRLRSTPQNIVILPPIYACLLLISLNHNTSSMSQVGHQDIEGGHAVIEGHRRQPEVAQAQLPQPCQGEPHFCDSSWPLYSMYSKIAQEEDDKIAERCQRNADGMLIFAGLFLATVATSITLTFPDLKRNPQDVSAFYLENIYQLLATLNSNSPTLIPSTLAKPPAFTPPVYVIWVNSLLFLSLGFSVAAAIIAILDQDWANRYIMATQKQSHTPHQRARIRAIFFPDTRGPDSIPGSSMTAFYLPISLFFFLAGGLVYLFCINRFVFIGVTWLVVIGMMDYTRRTVTPICKPDTVYYAPFSFLAFRLYLGTLYSVFKVCSCIAPLRGLCVNMRERYYYLSDLYREGFFSGRQKEVKDAIPKRATELDTDILESTLHSCLGKDDDLEEFFEAIPGFFGSKVVKNLKEDLPDAFRTKFCHVFHEFLDRAFSSDSIPESLRSRRVLICLNAARAALGLDQVSRVLDNIFSARWDGPPRGPLQSVDNVRENYDGDSASLAILTHITHQLCRSDFPSWGLDVLRQLPSFDIRNTLPGLQRDFCALWNNIFQESQKGGDGSNPSLILREIHHFYIALHQGTDAATTACSGPIANDDDIPFVASCGSVDRGPYSNSSFPALNQGPSHAWVFPAAEPTFSGIPISTSSRHNPLEVQGLITSPWVVASTGTPQSNVDITAASGLTNPIPSSPSGSGPTLQAVNKAETIPPSIVLGSPSIPVPTSVVSKDMVSAVPLHLSIDSAVPRTAHIQHTLVSTSTSASAAVLFPMSSGALDQHTTRTMGTAGIDDDSYHQNLPIHLDDFRHTMATQSAGSVTDMVQIPRDAKTADVS